MSTHPNKDIVLPDRQGGTTLDLVQNPAVIMRDSSQIMSLTLGQASVNAQEKATQPPRPKVSIIVLNWNTRELTLQCLKSLKQSLSDFEAQMIAVDNDSSDGSADAIAENHPDVCLIRSPENVGFARGNNLALPAAQGQYIFLLNSDTIVLPGAVQHLVNYLDEHPEIAGVGGEHLTADNEVVPHGMFFPSLWSDLSMALGLRKFGPLLLKRRSRLALLWYPLDTREVDWLSNSFVAIRREAIDRVGPLPEEFFLYGEDVEWYWRFREAGLRVAYVAGAPIVHLANKSSDQLYKGNEKSYRYLDGFYTFSARHRNPISWRLGWLANSLYWTALATRSCAGYLITGNAQAAEKARMLWAFARYHVDQVTGRVPPIAR